MTTGKRASRWKRLALHAARIVLFSTVIGLVHLQYLGTLAEQRRQPVAAVELDDVLPFFPTAYSLVDGDDGRKDVRNEAAGLLGYVVQTSPASDDLIGFSGPTNTLIALDTNNRIIGIQILSSGDTRDHVAQVRRDEPFMKAFNGLTEDQVAEVDVDAVSGATLTSLTIQESIIQRLGGGQESLAERLIGRGPSLRFPDPVTVGQAREVFTAASTVRQDEQLRSLWYVFDQSGVELGTVLRTSPFADQIIGYQGPTEARICFDTTGRIVGLSVGNSYDNDEYVTYVREDDYFLTLFNKMKLDELAQLNLEDGEVEGVSGATMTSMAIADGLIAAAEQHRRDLEAARRPPDPLLKWSFRDFGTAAVIAAGLAIALTRLRGVAWLRRCFQLILIVYLGIINGDMISQAMLFGWAQTGVPWSRAGGLTLLTLAAFLVPLTSRRNPYCSHLCPHGAAQQLLKNRLPWKLRLPGRLAKALKLVPAVLVAWCILVIMTALPFSLVDIEPFDAWVFRVAGWATITIALVGLVASLFVPMAYCRFGCPTGAVLDFLKFSGQSHRWSRRDWLALALLGLAAGLWIAV